MKIGNIQIAGYTYEEETNRLKKLDYGNGDRVEYSYDSQGRLIQKKYEDNQMVSYQYDNCGNLATVTDSATGVVTTYYYDLLNRNVGYREKGPNLDHSVTYIYDAENNISSTTEVINGVSKTYSYTYNDDNQLISETVDGITVTYTYDSFGRLSRQATKHGNTVISTIFSTYSAGKTGNTTSTQVSGYNGYTYTYDDNGNILSVKHNNKTTTYVYDSQNQLIRENNEDQGYTHTWTYDNGGNIRLKNEYAYTTGALGTAVKTVAYQYRNGAWGDMLASYDGNAISYDGIGNPIWDGIWNYTWKHGRQLVSMSNGTTTWNYTYNADGLRTKRTNGTDNYTYVYSGSQLAMMTVGENTLHFTYDASGVPLAVKYNGTTYYYNTNLQGDIMAIVDSTGTAVVTYAYDAWGVLLNITGTMKDTLGTINPLTYRGYVYDRETGLYYLQSRYYDPEMGRFINADGLVATGQGFVGNNMFAYCGNNPVLYGDYIGTDAICVVRYTWGDNGLPVVGHIQLYIQDSDEIWYLTEYTGPTKVLARVEFDIASMDDVNLMLKKEDTGNDYLYIEGDFSKSIALAQSYAGGDYGGYSLISNNCCDYVNEILNAGTFKYSLVEKKSEKNINPVPVLYFNKLKTATDKSFFNECVQNYAGGVGKYAGPAWTELTK